MNSIRSLATSTLPAKCLRTSRAFIWCRDREPLARSSFDVLLAVLVLFRLRLVLVLVLVQLRFVLVFVRLLGALVLVFISADLFDRADNKSFAEAGNRRNGENDRRLVHVPFEQANRLRVEKHERDQRGGRADRGAHPDHEGPDLLRRNFFREISLE